MFWHLISLKTQMFYSTRTFWMVFRLLTGTRSNPALLHTQPAAGISTCQLLIYNHSLLSLVSWSFSVWTFTEKNNLDWSTLLRAWMSSDWVPSMWRLRWRWTSAAKSAVSLPAENCLIQISAFKKLSCPEACLHSPASLKQPQLNALLKVLLETKIHP